MSPLSLPPPGVSEANPSALADVSRARLEALAFDILQDERHNGEAILKSVRTALAGERSSPMVDLAIGEAICCSTRSVVFRASDGCYEALVYDANTERVTRRRYTSAPKEQF